MTMLKRPAVTLVLFLVLAGAALAAAVTAAGTTATETARDIRTLLGMRMKKP